MFHYYRKIQNFAQALSQSGNGDYHSDKDESGINSAYDKVCQVNTITNTDNVENRPITSDVRTQHEPPTAQGETFQFIVVETYSGDPLNLS